MSIEIKLPEIGDGIESGDVLEVLVSEGETVEEGQDIVEMETDKATMGVPSPQAGTVVKILVAEGDTVPVGGALIELEPAGAGTSTDSEEPKAEKPKAATPPNEEPQEEVKEEHEEEPTSVKPVEAEKPPAKPPEKPATPVQVATVDTATDGSEVPAGPGVRRLAREMGVDLTRVTGTGKSGRIERDDIMAYVRTADRGTTSNDAAGSGDRDAFGPVRIERMPKIRKMIAGKMHESWITAPRVTNFDDADVTELERIRQANKADYAEKGMKLTTMPFLIKAVATALKNHPSINASVDMEAGQIVYKEYVNVGIAVDTDRGLVVPVMKDTDQSSMPGIARRLTEMAGKVRDGEFTVDDTRGGTFTISNLGAIGGTYSTPIINVPEVAILLVGRSRKMPVVVNDEIKIRLMMPLSLSYDHRLVDGGAAARFLNEVIEYLEAPSRLLMAP